MYSDGREQTDKKDVRSGWTKELWEKGRGRMTEYGTRTLAAMPHVEEGRMSVAALRVVGVPRRAIKCRQKQRLRSRLGYDVTNMLDDRVRVSSICTSQCRSLNCPPITAARAPATLLLIFWSRS